jgi:hypothetical protein
VGLFFSFYLTEIMMSNPPELPHSETALDMYVEIFLHGVMLQKEAA